jgi:hypothetical protein
VVVDQGKKALGKTIEVSVTSVLQTTAGKMIFCRWIESAADDRRVGERTDRFRAIREYRAPREGERTDRTTVPDAAATPAPAAPESQAMAAPPDAAEGSTSKPS